MHGGVIAGNTVTREGGDGGNAGGGVRVASYQGAYGIFRMSGGIIHGDDSPEGLRNSSRSDRALGVGSDAIAKHGTFNAGAFNRIGDLTNTDFTVEVANGALLQPQP